jgi:hypothetical protein
MASDQETPNAGETPDGNEVRDRRERDAERNRATPEREAATDRDALDDAESLKAEVARLKAFNKKANDESAARRKRLEELERAQEERENAQLGEKDRLQKERDDFAKRLAERERLDAERQEQIKSLTIRHAVEEEARRLNFEYPDLVPAMLPRGEVELDEDGKVIGAKAAVEKLAKDRPGLVTASRGGGTPPRDGQGGRRPLNGGGAPQSLEERTTAELSATGRYRQF